MNIFKRKEKSVFDRFKNMWKNHPAELIKLSRMILHHGLTVHGEEISLGSESKGIEIYEDERGDWDLVAQIPTKSFIKEVIGV